MRIRHALTMLGLDEDDCSCSLYEIRQAYKRGTLRWHPDRPTGSDDGFKCLGSAMHRLMQFKTPDEREEEMAAEDEEGDADMDSDDQLFLTLNFDDTRAESDPPLHAPYSAVTTTDPAEGGDVPHADAPAATDDGDSAVDSATKPSAGECASTGKRPPGATGRRSSSSTQPKKKQKTERGAPLATNAAGLTREEWANTIMSQVGADKGNKLNLGNSSDTYKSAVRRMLQDHHALFDVSDAFSANMQLHEFKDYVSKTFGSSDRWSKEQKAMNSRKITCGFNRLMGW